LNLKILRGVTKKIIEKSSENIQSLTHIDPFQDHDSSLNNEYDDTGETNCPHHTYTLLNESPIVIDDDDVDDSLNDINNSGVIDVRNKLNMPIPVDQITVSDDSEDDTDSDKINYLIAHSDSSDKGEKYIVCLICIYCITFF